jgi:gamma-glutamyltranspeptidase/glutathione hydrolase
MRDFQLPGRSTAYAQHGMAATSHPLATLTALDVLRGGGNAVDAAIAAVAVQCVVDPHMTGIGGDCFALFSPASGGVIGVNGSGKAPAGISAEALLAKGIMSVAPGPGMPHCVTVPGAVAAWGLIAQRFGTKGLDELLRPAIACAEDGFVVTPRVAYDWAGNADRLAFSPGGAAFYLPGGKPPSVGRILRFPALVRTLKRIAEHGPSGFYEGEVAARMVATLKGFGGYHELEDFAAAEAELVEPIHSRYRDVQVYECPPNGQGVIALLMLNILEGFDTARMEPLGVQRFHLQAEATKLAFAERDRHVADPAFAEVPTARLLDKGFAAELRERIDPERASAANAPPRVEPGKDTVYVTVVDRDLNAVSFINSIYDAFGSGLVCQDTGVIFHSRGRSFRLAEGHPNRLGPRKRPMHTIIPAMAFRGGELWMSFGVKGGDYQPVGHAHVIGNMIDFGMDPQEAIDAARIMAYPGDVEVERGISAATRAGLEARGHRVVDASAPWGGGQAIVIDRQRGVLVGGSDPRKDGLALGY